MVERNPVPVASTVIGASAELAAGLAPVSDIRIRPPTDSFTLRIESPPVHNDNELNRWLRDVLGVSLASAKYTQDEVGRSVAVITLRDKVLHRSSSS